MLEVDIYFDSLKVKATIEDWDFGPYELFSNIGGNLGLFLGICIFSVVEVIDFMVLLLATCIKRPRKTDVTPLTIAYNIDMEL